jgi:hypothetical protein
MRAYGIWLVAVAAGLACTSRAKSNDTGADAANQTLLRKLDGYLTCHTDHTRKVFRIADLYRQRFADAPPGPDSEVVLPPASDPAECLEAIEAARQLPPALPALDAAGAAYGAAIADVRRLTVSYDRTRAAELHPQLLAAFGAFDRAQAALFDQLYTLNRTAHIAQFAVRAHGEVDAIENIVEKLELAAEDVARFAAVPWNELERIDTTALQNSVAGLERSIESLHAFEERQPEQIKLDESFYTILDHADDLAAAARGLARRARDRVAYSDAEQLMIRAGNEANVAGTPASLAHAYNDLAERR